MQQFLSALNRKLPENEFASQVKADGDYYIELSDVKKSGITIVGSSGSGRSTTLRRLLDGMGSVASSHEPIIVIDQKGEHRGIAWKYKWGVYGFASDSQSKQFRLPTFLSSDDEGRAELAASILQEWLLQSGANCSDQQRERMASLIRAQGNSASLETVSKTFFGEKELDLISKKLSKGLLARNVFSRVFSEEQIKVEDFKSGKSLLFDVSGRGMRDPTTKEERLIASVLILKIFVDLRVEGYTIVLEDALDRFKSDNLRRRVISYVTELRNRNNAIVATSRAQVREFVGGDSLEILHRLSGEKILAEEVSGFKTSRPIRGLAGVVIFLPRGFAFTSAVGELASAAVRIEPLVFAYSTA